MSGDIVCEKCGMIFVSNRKLEHHLTQVHEQHHWQCQSCNKVLDNEKQFRIHMGMHNQLQRNDVTDVKE
jgi:uncharacterized C2H2 Zn-finger protein